MSVGISSLRSSRYWCEFFANNASKGQLLTCETQVRISNRERRTITKSIQAFQLGESSEGLHLYRCAERYAKTTGDYEYFDAIKLFIKEEQRHSQYLARFMKMADIPLARKIFVDSVFRGLRKLANLECSISVLLTAEIIANVYYRALHDATQSCFLRDICKQILIDEKSHVEFQAERLAMLRRERKLLWVLFTNFAHRILFAGTLVAVWVKCRQTLLAGGYKQSSFFRDCWFEFNQTMDLMDFRKYRETAPAVSAFD